MIDFPDVVRVESERLAAALEAAAPTAPVPTCPGWTALDLAWHLAAVQEFWAGIVEINAASPDEVERPQRPDDGEILPALRDGCARLVEVLARHEPAEGCWTWSRDDHTVGFVLRRQAHEALIHRVDAELTAQRPVTPINSDLAADGVDEVVRVMIGGFPDWGRFTPDGSTVRLEAVDAGTSGATWGLAFGRFVGTSPDTGNEYDLEAATVGLDALEPDAVISGRAEDLDLWLWGRRDLDCLQVEGDRGQAERLRRLAAEATQ